MNDRILRRECCAAAGAVLWMTLYTRLGPEGVLGSVLAAAAALLTGLAVYFLRIWLSPAWARGFCVLAAAAVSQCAWIKIQLAPWWGLAVLTLLLPKVENLRAAGLLKQFAVQCGLFLAAANAFLLLRHLLAQSFLSLFAEHASGSFLILGLLMLVLQWAGNAREDAA